jgi:hypothetical protein
MVIRPRCDTTITVAWWRVALLGGRWLRIRIGRVARRTLSTRSHVVRMRGRCVRQFAVREGHRGLMVRCGVCGVWRLARFTGAGRRTLLEKK